MSTNECQKAFRQLKWALCCCPILAYPRTTGKLILDIDGSYNSIGAVLSQIHGGKEKVIEYYSKI